MKMNNFEFEHNGQKLWYSRSLACNAIIFRLHEDFSVDVLACKRGQGCEFNKGLWNVPGGFIDFDEDAKQCALRELHEETGISIDYSRIWFFKLDSQPRGARQTMVASHVGIFAKATTDTWIFSTEYSEPDETEEIKWIPIEELDKYEWTRGQKENIMEALTRFLK